MSTKKEEADEGWGAQAAARTYAWEWFKYHAGQRQSVFRFYLIISGAVFTGYFASTGTARGELREFAYLSGLLLLAISFLFWRLDVRSQELVKIAEKYLKVDELILSKRLFEENARVLGSGEENVLDGDIKEQCDSIRLAFLADDVREERRIVIFFRMRSFRQIYFYIFLLLSLLGASIAIFDSKSPVRSWITSTYLTETRPSCLL